MDLKNLKGIEIKEGNVIKLEDSFDNILFDIKKIIPIDLGLSVQWANCNVGTTLPYESGLYFQWGDTKGWTKEDIEQGNKSFNFDSYKFTNDSGKTFNKYKEKGLFLEPEDDAVTVNMGDEWRMPTEDETNELLKLSRKWVNKNGINGYEFTGKNGKKLFIPATGYVKDNTINSENSEGLVWTSNICSGNVKQGKLFYFYNGGGQNFCLLDRSYGLTIRGVKK